MDSDMPETRSPYQELTVGQLKHDLRNPVGQILGFSEMLIEDLRDLGNTDHLDKLYGACTIARALLNGIDVQLSSGGVQPQEAVPESLVVQLKSRLDTDMTRLLELHLEDCPFAKREPFSDDVRAILAAAIALRAVLESALAGIRARTPFKTGAV
jgi:signal transduction histidine kinase